MKERVSVVDARTIIEANVTEHWVSEFFFHIILDEDISLEKDSMFILLS